MMKIKEEILLKYLWKLESSTRLDTSYNFELNALSNLYRNYCDLNDFLELNEIKNNKVLLNYEDDIYTIDGVELTQIQRVEFELNKIEKEFNESNLDREIYDMLIILRKMLLDYKENEDKELLNYIKKEISFLQAGLDLNNNFLLASYEAFLEKYRNICINNQNKYLKKNKYVR